MYSKLVILGAAMAYNFFFSRILGGHGGCRAMPRLSPLLVLLYR
jgi:hypothetical protein